MASNCHHSGILERMAHAGCRQDKGSTNRNEVFQPIEAFITGFLWIYLMNDIIKKEYYIFIKKVITLQLG
jgi:hypothetical protein